MSLGDEHGYGGDSRGRTDDGYGGYGPDPYPTRRRQQAATATAAAAAAARSSRSLITVVGVVVLLDRGDRVREPRRRRRHGLGRSGGDKAEAAPDGGDGRRSR